MEGVGGEKRGVAVWGAEETWMAINSNAGKGRKEDLGTGERG